MIFSVEQVRSIRQGKITAALVTRSENLAPGMVRPLRRRFVHRNEFGEPIGTLVDTVQDPIPNTTDRVPVLLTILAVRDLELAELSLVDARACGYRTIGGLRDAWRTEHPRTVLVRLAHFALGDLRDRPRFLAAIPFHSDYTSSMRDAAPGEPEALSEQQLATYATMNGQRFLRARADLATTLAMRGLGQRLAVIQATAAASGVDVRAEMRIIEQRLDRAERRIAGEVSVDEH